MEKRIYDDEARQFNLIKALLVGYQINQTRISKVQTFNKSHSSLSARP
jgi:hypothetical protein